MQSVKFLKKITYKPTFRTEQICGIYDLEPKKTLEKEFVFDIDLNFDWQIGMIVGLSGSGKSSLAKELFTKNYDPKHKWTDDTSFLNDFSKDISIKEICKCLSNIGFSSPPLWLLPYRELSTGQKFRVDVVRSILESEEMCCIDEFTSVVDRNVAKIGSHCIQKFIRKTNKKFVAVSCHSDIQEWLQPDWIFDVDTNKLTRGYLQRPKIELKIYEEGIEKWELFRKYHYLNTSIHKGAKCFVGYVWDIPVVFGSYLTFPHPKIKKTKRGHRTVVLPDFQGLGIGNKMSDFVAKYCINKGFRYFSTTSQPSMIYYRNKSKNWKIIRLPSKLGGFKRNTAFNRPNSTSFQRITTSFEYIDK
jgi:ABC-type lipoprotein export system ATPase subunit